MNTAYSYVRFSSKPQERGDSLRRQVALARRYAAEHSLTLVETSYQDLGISAFKGKNAVEGALGAFLEAVDDGRIPRGSYLLVESMDRISRQQLDEALELFLSIIRRGITIVTLQDGQVYSKEKIKEDKGFSLIVSIMVMSRAHEESATKAKRVKEAWDAKRERGGILTRMGPGWLTWDDAASAWKIDKQKAKLVQRAFKYASQGHGSPTIARKLNAEFRDKDGFVLMLSKQKRRDEAQEWSASNVAALLKNKAVYGIRRSPKAKAEEIEAYPAILDKAVFDQVQRNIAANSKVGGGQKGENIANLFAGLCFCECGSKMRYVSAKKPHLYLQCIKSYSGGDCDAPQIPYNAVEEQVLDWLVGFGRISENATSQIDPRASMQADLELKQKEVENLTAMVAAGGARGAPKALLNRMHALEDEIAELETDIGRYIPTPSPSKTLQAAKELLKRHTELKSVGSKIQLKELRTRLQSEIKQLINRFVFLKKIEQHEVDDLPSTTSGEYGTLHAHGPLVEEALINVYPEHEKGKAYPDDHFTSPEGGLVIEYYLPKWGIKGTRRRIKAR